MDGSRVAGRGSRVCLLRGAVGVGVGMWELELLGGAGESAAMTEWIPRNVGALM